MICQGFRQFLYFNSLPHTEVDFITNLQVYFYIVFQLTTSHKGRPGLRNLYLHERKFQLTTSHRGRQQFVTKFRKNLHESHNKSHNKSLFFHFKHRITITKRKKAVFFWCESPRKIMCTLHSHYKINVPVTSNPGCAPMCSTLFL